MESVPYWALCSLESSAPLGVSSEGKAPREELIPDLSQDGLPLRACTQGSHLERFQVHVEGNVRAGAESGGLRPWNCPGDHSKCPWFGNGHGPQPGPSPGARAQGRGATSIICCKPLFVFCQAKTSCSRGVILINFSDREECGAFQGRLFG